MKKNLLILILLTVFFFLFKEFWYIYIISVSLFVVFSYNICVLSIKMFSKENLSEKKEKNIEYVVLIAIFSSIFLMRYFENTIGGYILFCKLAFGSVVLAVLIVLILNRFIHFNINKINHNILSICISTFVLIPSLGAMLNAKFYRLKTTEIVEINRKDIIKGKYSDSYAIFIKTKYDSDEILEIDENFYDKISNNQTVKLHAVKGILGYNYIWKIEAVE